MGYFTLKMSTEIHGKIRTIGGDYAVDLSQISLWILSVNILLKLESEEVYHRLRLLAGS